MKWKKFKIKTRTEAEDIIISTLYDIRTVFVISYVREKGYKSSVFFNTDISHCFVFIWSDGEP